MLSPRNTFNERDRDRATEVHEQRLSPMDTINEPDRHRATEVHEQRLATDAMVTEQPRPESAEIMVADCDSSDLLEADEEEECSNDVFLDEKEDPDDMGAGEENYVPEGEPRTPAGQKKRKSNGPSSRKRKLGTHNDAFDVVFLRTIAGSSPDVTKPKKNAQQEPGQCQNGSTSALYVACLPGMLTMEHSVTKVWVTAVLVCFFRAVFRPVDMGGQYAPAVHYLWLDPTAVKQHAQAVNLAALCRIVRVYDAHVWDWSHPDVTSLLHSLVLAVGRIHTSASLAVAEHAVVALRKTLLETQSDPVAIFGGCRQPTNTSSANAPGRTLQEAGNEIWDPIPSSGLMLYGYDADEKLIVRAIAAVADGFNRNAFKGIVADGTRNDGWDPTCKRFSDVGFLHALLQEVIISRLDGFPLPPETIKQVNRHPWVMLEIEKHNVWQNMVS